MKTVFKISIIIVIIPIIAFFTFLLINKIFDRVFITSSFEDQSPIECKGLFEDDEINCLVSLLSDHRLADFFYDTEGNVISEDILENGEEVTHHEAFVHLTKFGPKVIPNIVSNIKIPYKKKLPIKKYESIKEKILNYLCSMRSQVEISQTPGSLCFSYLSKTGLWDYVESGRIWAVLSQATWMDGIDVNDLHHNLLWLRQHLLLYLEAGQKWDYNDRLNSVYILFNELNALIKSKKSNDSLCYSHNEFEKLIADEQTFRKVFNIKHTISLNHHHLKSIFENRNCPKCSLFSAGFLNRNLDKANFEKADLYLTTFQGTSLDKANLSSTNLKWATFFQTNLKNSNFENANLEGAYLGQTTLRGANFENAKLIKATFFKVNMDNHNIETVQLFNTRFKDCELSNKDSFGETVKDLKSHNKNQSGTNFLKADFSLSNLQYVNLSGADLRQVNFQNANLRCVNFSGADLRQANFENANLQYIDFSNADLTGAKLTHTYFKEVIY